MGAMQSQLIKRVGVTRIVLVGVLVVMCAVFSLAVPGFLGKARLLSVLNYAYFLGFLSLGVTFVIATGGIDFSIGPVMFCCALIAGYTKNAYGAPLWFALLLSVLIGLGFGIVNGAVVAHWKVPPFIVSMASMNIAKGVSSVFTKTQAVSWPTADSADGWYRKLVRLNDFPLGLFILLGVALILGLIMYRTRAGRYITSLGSNKEAVRLSGVNTKKWEMLAYVVCGLMAGIAAIFFVGAYMTVQPGYGDQYNNEAIACCVMGGTSMAGGVASIGGTLIGVLIICFLQEGILAIGLTKDIQQIITGVIVIFAVFADVVTHRRSR